MSHTKALTAGAAIAVLAGMLLLPGVTFARGGGGFAAAGHGPVFGFHPRVGHPLRLARRHPGPFGLHLWNRHLGHQDGIGAIYPAADSGYATPNPNDVTGTLPLPGSAVFAPPAAPPSEHVGCLSHGYDVPGENGGAARVVVTRC